MKKKIFMVDDSAINLNLVKKGLSDHYDVTTISSAAALFDNLEKEIPDLILLDIIMPVMDGYQALELIKNKTEYADIPVIFLTGRNNEEDEVKGLELGAVDFITKPFSLSELYNRVRLHISESDIIKERTRALEDAHRSLMFVLADIVESRDTETGGHVDRTTKYVKILIEAMLQQKVYASQLENWNVEDVALCAALHDVGKIGVSDTIINKPGKLTQEEFEEMKDHATAGAEIISRVTTLTGEDRFLSDARLFAEYHHENWDGSGYPYGIKGEAIPIHGRIMTFADVYDALVSERPYKVPFTHDVAVEMIMKDAGKKFDPQIAKVFFSIHDKFNKIASRQD